jgi:RNA polymerase sigma-70 factor (ECF subfamily)
MNDIKSLIERCLAKDKEAWNEFVRRFRNLIYQSIRTRFSRTNFSYTTQDIEDVMQEIFLDLWERDKLEQVRDTQKIQAWLAIISQNRARDYMRQKVYRMSRVSTFVDDAVEDKDLLESLPSDGISVREELLNAELKSILDEIIESLSAKARLVIGLLYLHGKNHREIAQIMHLSTNTVSTIIRRAKIKIRDELIKRGYK